MATRAGGGQWPGLIGAGSGEAGGGGGGGGEGLSWVQRG